MRPKLTTGVAVQDVMECTVAVPFRCAGGERASGPSGRSSLFHGAMGLEGSRGIPAREAAVLRLRIRVYQLMAGGGDRGWVQVGDDSGGTGGGGGHPTQTKANSNHPDEEDIEHV